MEKHFLNFPVFPFPDRLPALEGGNERGVLVIFRPGEAEKDLTAYLAKVLSAVQLELAKDVSLLKATPGMKLSFARLCNNIDINVALIFGLQPPDLGLRLQAVPDQPLQLSGRTLLFTAELQEIRDERQRGETRRAAALWQALQEIFPQDQ